MIKPFSKASLKVFNFLFKFSFSRKIIESETKQYITEKSRGISTFEHVLVKFNYEKESQEYKYLRDLFMMAVTFRSNKKLVKNIIENFFFTPLMLLIIVIPFCVPIFCFKKDFSFWYFVIIFISSIFSALLLAIIVQRGTEFIKNFEVKVGKALSRMSQILFICTIGAGVYFALEFEESIIKAIIFSIYSILYSVVFFTVLKFMFAEVLVDAYYFSQKIQITDALILESAYRLSVVNWNYAIKRKNLRQNTIIEIERLASLIENDWSNHILPGDEKTNKWKIDTLIGIASSLRKMKRQLIISSTESPTALNSKFNDVFHKLLIHDWQGLIDSDVPAARVRKKSKLDVLQSLLVAVLPVALSISIKFYAPEVIGAAYIQIAIIISSLWLVVCSLLWLDPNLADKIATVKSVRSVFKTNDTDN